MKLLGKAHDPEFWREVREEEHFKDYRDGLLDHWEKTVENYVPEWLKYSEFKLFWTTGDRHKYEGPYFRRRAAMVTSALLSLVYPDEQKYLDKLMDIIYSICDEYTWCLPAHQGKLEPNNNSRIDLFASETGYMLAEICTLLEDRLEPLIKNRIMAETFRRIVKPFTDVENYGWWENGNMNWTAVCMGSVACTMMLLYPEKADDKFIDRTLKSMEGFLGGFLDDGICAEGCGYWGYGFGFFVLYADMVRTYTNGRIDLFKKEKVKTVSMFLQRMFLTGNASVSFADGGRTLTYDRGLLHYLKNEYPDDILVYSPKYSHKGTGKFSTYLRSASWYNKEYAEHPADDSIAREFFAPNTQWFVKRTEAYGFAAKGGNNNEFHNHNDVGSFIFAKNGKQLLMDLGSGVYTRQYFAIDTRYSILECSSRGHNLPIVNGVEQFFGSDAKADKFEYQNGKLEAEIAGAYKCEGLTSIKRSFEFTDTEITLTDSFAYSGSGDIVERMVSLIKPEVLENGKIAIETAEISFDFEKYELSISEELRERGDTCYLIDFKLKTGINSFICHMK